MSLPYGRETLDNPHPRVGIQPSRDTLRLRSRVGESWRAWLFRQTRSPGADRMSCICTEQLSGVQDSVPAAHAGTSERGANVGLQDSHSGRHILRLHRS